jgi:transcriptional regulator with XRE-family HTH domain
VDERRPVPTKKRRKPGASRACKVLALRVAGLQLSHREIERELGWGHGSLSNLLSGRTQIRLRHVEALAPILGSTPGELFNDIYYGERVEQSGLPPQWEPAPVQCMTDPLTIAEEMLNSLKAAELQMRKMVRLLRESEVERLT